MQTELLINKKNISQTKYIKNNQNPLKDNEVRLELNSFAFTANNVTYAVTGGSFKYWQFFPTEEGWGKLPVWGFATIVESSHTELQVGERIYGFFPLATHLTVSASKVKAHSFQDGAEHRKDLNPVYNTYTRTHNSAGFNPEQNHINALLRPMFTTSFLIDDYFADNNLFDAQNIILSSASSKTAIGTAFLLKQNKASRSAYTITGLTSEKNKAFVKALACYDQVLAYEDLDQLDTGETSAYIDFAGSGTLRRDLHNMMKDNLTCSSLIGLAHWQDAAKREELPGATPTVFFAPAQIQKRMKDWGPDGFNQKLSASWVHFLGMADNWLEIEESSGEEAIIEVYKNMLSGNAEAKKGFILSF